MLTVKALIVTGLGINCEKEMAEACEEAGAKADIIHTQNLLSQKVDMNSYHFLCLPGGFSFGDELGAAKVFANRIKQGPLISELKEFVRQGKCILGICNGFQLLVKLGLLPGNVEGQLVSLTCNANGHFDNRWAKHTVSSRTSVFTSGLKTLSLPIRHGEGKFTVANPRVLEELKKNGQIVFRYEGLNPNGSTENIAGISDSTGRILGMMAHPEAAFYFTNDPQWIRKKEVLKRQGSPLPKYGDGYPIFKNVIDYLKESL